MTIDAAVLAFTLEVGRASREAGVASPVVRVEALSPGVLAQHQPGEVTLGLATAWAATDRGIRRARPWLRCIARHEVAHEARRHRPLTLAERDANEAEIGPFLRTAWSERDPRCEAHLR